MAFAVDGQRVVVAGAARSGIAAARGKWIIMGDADASYDFSEIVPFIEKLREGKALVMGCRLPAKASSRSAWASRPAIPTAFTP